MMTGSTVKTAATVHFGPRAALVMVTTTALDHNGLSARKRRRRDDDGAKRSQH
jgi:hypothetical protein